jgi:small subunit ribosomal protein S14
MAKKSKVAAERRRRETVARHAERREALRALVRTSTPGSLQQLAAIRELAAMPRDSSPVRLRNRDQVDGRPRGFLRKFGLSRIRFREMAHQGELPGIRKSSW